MIEQLAEILKISPDVLCFFARRVPGDVNGDFDDRATCSSLRKNLLFPSI